MFVLPKDWWNSSGLVIGCYGSSKLKKLDPLSRQKYLEICLAVKNFVGC